LDDGGGDVGWRFVSDDFVEGLVEIVGRWELKRAGDGRSGSAEAGGRRD